MQDSSNLIIKIKPSKGAWGLFNNPEKLKEKLKVENKEENKVENKVENKEENIKQTSRLTILEPNQTKMHKIIILVASLTFLIYSIILPASRVFPDFSTDREPFIWFTTSVGLFIFILFRIIKYFDLESQISNKLCFKLELLSSVFIVVSLLFYVIIIPAFKVFPNFNKAGEVLLWLLGCFGIIIYILIKLKVDVYLKEKYKVCNFLI
jgi:hypothetical protein